MAGALELLKKILSRAPRAEAQALEEEIGREFYRAADREPDMFLRGRAFADSRDGLENQFGVLFADTNNPNMTRVRVPGAPISFSPSMLEHDISGAKTLLGPDWTNYPVNGRYIEFDTSGLSQIGGSSGVGAGRGAYGAMFGSLLDDPKKMNVVAALTGRNEHRRNYNQAAALLRDRRLAKQILLDPYQMTSSDVTAPVPEPREFMSRSPEAQVGALQAQGALQLLRRLGRTRDYIGAHSLDGLSDVDMILDDTIDNAVDPASFQAAAGALRTTGAPSHLYDTIGDSALRRAALVSDVVSGAPVRRHLFRGLEYRLGGRVNDPEV